MVTFQGPTRPTTDRKKFKETGSSNAKDSFQRAIDEAVEIVKQKIKDKEKKSSGSSGSRSSKNTPIFQGPVLPTTDSEQFKETGKVITKETFSSTPQNKLIKDLTTKDRFGRIKPTAGLISSQEKENERLRDQNIIQASIPRQFTSQKQIQSYNYSKQKAQERETDKILNTLEISPKKKTNAYINFENKLYNEYLRIQRKSVNLRTQKEMALIGIYGIGATGLGTIRKIPQAAWDTLVAFIRPDLLISGITKIAIDPEVRAQVNKQISDFGAKLQQGDPDAVSSLAAEIFGLKAANKIISETGKVASITKPVRILKEIKFTRSQPKELRPFIKQILKGARVQEGLTPNNLKGINKINFNEVQELNKIEAKALKKTLQETDSFVFGSLPSRTLSGGKTKLPKDVDLATKDIKKFQEKFIKNLPEKIRKNYIIGKEYIKKGNSKILDIKGYDRLRPDQTIFGTGRLPINSIVYSSQGKKILKTSGLKIPTQSLKTIEGIKITGFGEQTTRKALGTLQVILEKGVRRAKDPAAFIESLEIQLAGLQGKIPKSKFVNKYLLKTKAKDLENSIKILKSKEFKTLLEKKIPGISKEYPILDKIKNLSTADKNKITDKVKDKINKITKSKTKSKSKTIPKSKIPKSKIPKSKIP
ncbi:MAG: hypothetical protein OEV44_00760, partial [Spirochaetota bacterium]|nr:hypothetical protein [Spirochaetota bacterium]